jgi:hypothetical protein
MGKKQKLERFKNITGSVEDFISGGFSEIVSVGEELREAYDNAPDNLKETDVNTRRDEAASTIENLSEPSVNSSILGALDCAASIDMGKTYRGRQSQSRACRIANGAAQLQAAVDAINSWLEDNDEIPEVDEHDAASLEQRAAKLKELKEAEIDPEDYEEARSEGESLVGDLEEIIGEAEGVDPPGMFG